jgi:ParB family chromosome partitioning protein
MAKGEEKAKTEPTTWLIREIEIDTIDQGDQLVRDDQNDEDIIELAADIARNGLLQPIGVLALTNGTHQLLWGARRLLAHLRIGRTTIPARIIDDVDTPVRATALRENLLRRALTLQEECHAVSDLHHQEKRSPDTIAHLIGRSRAWVLRRLAVPNLPPDLREPALDGTLALGAAEAIALLDDPATRALVLQNCLASKASVGQVRETVRCLRESPDFGAAVAAGADHHAHPDHFAPILMACAACGAAR